MNLNTFVILRKYLIFDIKLHYPSSLLIIYNFFLILHAYLRIKCYLIILMFQIPCNCSNFVAEVFSI